MNEYIEIGNRVFHLTVTPDTPGYMRRQFTAQLVSGPPMTEEEYQRVSAEVVADLVARGIDVHGWSAIGDDEGDVQIF